MSSRKGLLCLDAQCISDTIATKQYDIESRTEYLIYLFMASLPGREMLCSQRYLHVDSREHLCSHCMACCLCSSVCRVSFPLVTTMYLFCMVSSECTQGYYFQCVIYYMNSQKYVKQSTSQFIICKVKYTQLTFTIVTFMMKDTYWKSFFYIIKNTSF